MAKSVRKPGPPKRESPSAAALHALDEFNNLRDVHRAFDCLQGLLSPYERHDSDELHITPHELRALITVLNGEMERRIQLVATAIHSVREALHAGGREA